MHLLTESMADTIKPGNLTGNTISKKPRITANTHGCLIVFLNASLRFTSVNLSLIHIYGKWAGEMEAVLDPLLDVGSSLEKDVKAAFKGSGLALRVTPWEHCALPLLEAGREADGYRLIEVGLKKKNCQEEPIYSYYPVSYTHLIPASRRMF